MQRRWEIPLHSGVKLVCTSTTCRHIKRKQDNNHLPTKAIQHLTPLRTDFCDRLEAPRMASILDSSNHTSLCSCPTPSNFIEFKAAIGPRPADVALGLRSLSSKAKPLGLHNRPCLGLDLATQSAHPKRLHANKIHTWSVSLHYCADPTQR